MKRNLLTVAAALLPILANPAARAHEYIVKPGVTQAAAGAKVPFSVSSSHVFMTSEELEDAEDNNVALFTDGKRQSLALTPRSQFHL